MIFSAILVACLASKPTECETYEMRLTEHLPFMQMVEAQTWAASWLKAHQGRVLRDLRVVRGVGA